MTDRQKKTAGWLIASTLLMGFTALIATSPNDDAGILSPIVFGLALVYSNYSYLKGPYAFFLPLYFLIIFMFGSPFIGHALTLNHPDLATFRIYTWPLSALILVLFCVKYCLRDFTVKALQVWLAILLPIVLVSGMLVLGVLPMIQDKLSVIAIFHQLCMTVIIISAMPNNESRANHASDG